MSQSENDFVENHVKNHYCWGNGVDEPHDYHTHVSINLSIWLLDIVVIIVHIIIEEYPENYSVEQAQSLGEFI